MAETGAYRENYFTRRKKFHTMLFLVLLSAAAVTLAAWYFHSRSAVRDPFAGKVVRIRDGGETIGLVKNFRAKRSISYYSADSDFHDLVFHRFRGDYSPAPSPPPPEVRIVSADEAGPPVLSGRDDGPALAEKPAPAAEWEEDTPGYALTREEGVRAYESEVSALAVKADRVDALWQKHREFCRGTIAVSVGNAYGRRWVGIYPTITAADTPECRMMVQDMRTLAAEIDDGMEAAWEKAHRAGVYPGQMRAVQQKYRMELDRWNR
jgi:hypothetical protein